MGWTTADLWDEHAGSGISVAEPRFRDFGGAGRFCGGVATVRVDEDNALVRAVLSEKGCGRVLVVDGGGSLRCALVGDVLAELARENGWTGLVVHGCVRDAHTLALLPIGVKALAACPAKSGKTGKGERDVVVAFAGVTFTPGGHLYADGDGILVAPRALHR